MVGAWKVLEGDTGSSQNFSIINSIKVLNRQMVLQGVYPARS